LQLCRRSILFRFQREPSYGWVKQALQAAGLVRQPLPGMLLHLDGCTHAWFGDPRHYDLLVVLEDATGEI
jgi:hypothetical protein